jgi:hypothetical protein
MTSSETIRQFYQRLNHKGYGVTELVIIDPNGKGIIATGFFNDNDAFVKACEEYNGRYNIYAGRNPRPVWLPKVCENHLDTRYRQRASDSDIEFVTAISLDIDPIRPKGTSATDEQHDKAIQFALMLHNTIGGWVYDSGNGAYLWIPFKTPIVVNDNNRDEIKQKCRLWQNGIIRRYQPEKYNLRIDGCFDLSRIKKVIGTWSVKGTIHRQSRFVKEGEASDKVRDSILSLSLITHLADQRITPTQDIPDRFIMLLRTNPAIQDLWLSPNEENDRSTHDWMLGCELAKEGLSMEEIASVLMINPFGKYNRDRRIEYIQNTVRNLMVQCG